MATSGLGVLTTDSQAPRVTQTTMDTGLHHTLEILTELVIQVVGKELAELTILNVLLTIEEPVGDLVLARVLHDGDNTLKISLIKLTGTTKRVNNLFGPRRKFVPLGGVNLSLAADKSGETATTTADGGQGEDDLLTTVNVGVENTEDMLESSLLGNVQRLHKKKVPISIISKAVKIGRSHQK